MSKDPDATLRQAKKELEDAERQRRIVDRISERIRKHIEQNDFAERLIREILQSRK